MPWELTVLRRDGHPLGELEAVRQAIRAAFPGVQFYREPSGPEKVTAAAQAGAPFPPFMAERLRSQPAAEQADYDRDGCSVRFLLGEPGGPVRSVGVEVRGEHARAEPMLRELARQTGWAIDHWADRGKEPFAG